MELKVIQLPGGAFQVFVDGNEVTFEQAAAISKALIAQLGAAIGGGVAIDGQIEQHRASNVQHAHVLGEIRHDH